MSPVSVLRGGGAVSVAEAMAQDIRILRMLDTLDRGFVPRTVAIQTAATLIYRSPEPRAIIVVNPSMSAGLTEDGVILASALRAAGSSGDTEATPLGVANYRRLALFLDISASTGGVVTIDGRVQDPLSLNWAESELSDLFGGPAAVGTYYAPLGPLGVEIAFAIEWAVSAAGNSTFSVGYVLKDGLPGSSSGVSRSVFLAGNSGVNVASGYELLEGDREKWYIPEGSELWGVGSSVVNIKLFEQS